MKKKIEVEIIIPSVPNFLSYGTYGSRESINISNFTEEELRELGKQWTEELVSKAKKMRDMESE